MYLLITATVSIIIVMDTVTGVVTLIRWQYA